MICFPEKEAAMKIRIALESEEEARIMDVDSIDSRDVCGLAFKEAVISLFLSRWPSLNGDNIGLVAAREDSPLGQDWNQDEIPWAEVKAMPKVEAAVSAWGTEFLRRTEMRQR
jgi:hypothetical protein